MHILNALFRLNRSLYQRCRRLFSSDYERIEDRREDLREGRTSTQSLTDEVKFFEDSDQAVPIFLFHAFIYYSAAIIAFSFTLKEWPIIDSAYYATTVFTTVGYGDLTPDTLGGKIFHVCLSVYGIVILGIFVGIVGEKLIEMHNKVISTDEKSIRSALLKTLAKTGDENESVLPGAGDLPLPPLYVEISSIVLLEAPIVLILFLLAHLIGHFEGWSLLDSSYWLVVTGTTVGFGDLSPTLPWTRFAAIFFLPLAVAVVGEFLARIASAYIERKRSFTKRDFLHRSLTRTDIDRMDTNRSGYVDEIEFLTYMLMALNKVDPEDLRDLRALFRKLDKTSDGHLSKADLTGHLETIRTAIHPLNGEPLI